MRAAKRPSEFDFLNVLTDRTAIGVRQFQKPFPNRYAPRWTHIESGRQFFGAINHYCVKIGTMFQAFSAVRNSRTMASQIHMFTNQFETAPNFGRTAGGPCLTPPRSPHSPNRGPHPLRPHRTGPPRGAFR